MMRRRGKTERISASIASIRSDVHASGTAAGICGGSAEVLELEQDGDRDVAAVTIGPRPDAAQAADQRQAVVR